MNKEILSILLNMGSKRYKLITKGLNRKSDYWTTCESRKVNLLHAESQARFQFATILNPQTPESSVLLCICALDICEQEAKMAAESNNLEEILRPFYQRASEAEVSFLKLSKTLDIWVSFRFSPSSCVCVRVGFGVSFS